MALFKQTILIFAAFLFLSDPLASSAAVTFPVADVQPKNFTQTAITLNDTAAVVQQFWNEKNTDDPITYETGEVNHGDLVELSMNNAMISAVLEAYNNHLPLILSPDDFWLLISLGTAQFLAVPENAEKYRHKLVDHEGKMELIVNVLGMGIRPKSAGNKDGWPKFVREIVGMIKANTKTDISELMTKNFTTTGNVEYTAMSVSLMESMKNYFEYTALLACGIPKIALEGEEADYVDMIERIEKLRTLFGTFDWYLSRVKGHMDKVLASVRGHSDRDWWRRMVMSEPEGSGGQEKLTGWISDFFPYSYDSEGKPQANTETGTKFNDFKSPLVTFTPVKLVDEVYTMKTYHMKFVAGFVGVAKKRLTGAHKIAVRPAIGWLTFYGKEE